MYICTTVIGVLAGVIVYKYTKILYRNDLFVEHIRLIHIRSCTLFDYFILSQCSEVKHTTYYKVYQGSLVVTVQQIFMFI